MLSLSARAPENQKARAPGNEPQSASLVFSRSLARPHAYEHRVAAWKTGFLGRHSKCVFPSQESFRASLIERSIDQ